jgi:hypothetical protein
MSVRRPLLAATSLGLCLFGLAECSRSPVAPPKFSPSAATRAALAEFDTNKDGTLDATELAACPGLLAAKDRMDTDHNGSLSEAEILARLKKHQSLGDLIIPFKCRVLLEGQPLPEATVALTPEIFMGATYKPATGTTGSDGDTVISADDIKAKGFSGVYAGIYRVRISRLGPGGPELVPPKYNTDTTLGQEVAQDIRELERRVVFNLSRR